MNSLSSFENSPNPLKSYIQHVSQDAVLPRNVVLSQIGNSFQILLPNQLCKLSVNSSYICVTRYNFNHEFSAYLVKNIDDAKILTGILSGVCREYGCSFKEANDIVHFAFGLFDQLNQQENENA